MKNILNGYRRRTASDDAKGGPPPPLRAPSSPRRLRDPTRSLISPWCRAIGRGCPAERLQLPNCPTAVCVTSPAPWPRPCLPSWTAPREETSKAPGNSGAMAGGAPATYPPSTSSNSAATRGPRKLEAGSWKLGTIAGGGSDCLRGQPVGTPPTFWPPADIHSPTTSSQCREPTKVVRMSAQANDRRETSTRPQSVGRSPRERPPIRLSHRVTSPRVGCIVTRLQTHGDGELAIIQKLLSRAQTTNSDACADEELLPPTLEPGSRGIKMHVCSPS